VLVLYSYACNLTDIYLDLKVLNIPTSDPYYFSLSSGFRVCSLFYTFISYFYSTLFYAFILYLVSQLIYAHNCPDY